MRIQLTSSRVSRGQFWDRGEILELDEHEAQACIKAGLAVEVAEHRPAAAETAAKSAQPVSRPRRGKRS